jgi:uncharacterized protein (TIGR03437 family)
MRYFFLAMSIGVASTCAWAQQYTISTFAGNHTPGYSGDGGAPTSAELNAANGMAFDSSGNLYIADSANQVIRKISNGTISTVAGTGGSGGYSGDGKAATSAQLLDPAGVALDSAGNLYIADTGNHVIRMVSTSGTINTIAGSNVGGYAGDGGAATAAELEFPGSVAIDGAGNIYIADSGNNVIREITGGIITTIVGDGFTSTFLDDPETVLLDGNGNLYICEGDALHVLKLALATSTVTTIAGSGNLGFSGDFGPAIDAEFDDPKGIALDSKGFLYVTDTNNNRIRKIAPDGIITTIAGVGLSGYTGDGGPATNATLSFPHGIAVDTSGKVYISDSDNNVIRLLTPVTPSVLAGGLVNAASFKPPVSPGALASIFGSNFVGTGLSGVAPTVPLPDNLGGVSVTINGRAAPVLYVNSGQINFQIPWETAPGSATLTVSSNGIKSASMNITVLAAAPGLFVQGSHAIVQNSDFSLNSSGNPAKVGETIMTYLTGAGAVSPKVADGAAASSTTLSRVTSTVTATIGSKTAEVPFAGLAPDFVGLWQVNVVVPTGLTQGDFPLIISVGGQSSNAANVSVTP